MATPQSCFQLVMPACKNTSKVRTLPQVSTCVWSREPARKLPDRNVVAAPFHLERYPSPISLQVAITISITHQQTHPARSRAIRSNPQECPQPPLPLHRPRPSS